MQCYTYLDFSIFAKLFVIVKSTSVKSVPFQILKNQFLHDIMQYTCMARYHT